MRLGVMNVRGGRNCARVAAVMVLLAAAGACSTDGLFGSQPSSGPTTSSGATTSSSGPRSFSERISDFISPTSKPPPAAPGSSPSEEIDCPRVDIRQGASTLSINDPKATSAALGLRYQGTIVRTARECAVRDKMVTIRVGVQGRIILGPEGGPGDVTVPIRYALVKEGIEPKTVYSKLYTIPVSIQPGQLNILFSHIEEQMIVPMPPVSEFEDYVIYVGYDPQGAVEEKQKKKPPAKPHGKAPRRTETPAAAR